MRPPIPSPDGTTIREAETPIILGEFALEFDAGAWASWRASVKGILCNPFLHLMWGIWVVLSLVPALWLFRSFGTSIFSGAVGYSFIIAPLQILLVTFAFLVLLCLLMAFFDRFLPKGQYFLTLTETGVAFKTKKAKRRRHLVVSWKRVRFIKEWEGDVLVSSFFLFVAVPKEAFHSEEERKIFVNAARQLRREAR